MIDFYELYPIHFVEVLGEGGLKIKHFSKKCVFFLPRQDVGEFMAYKLIQLTKLF